MELKGATFRPEHAGQLNFYLAAVDAQLNMAAPRPGSPPPLTRLALLTIIRAVNSTSAPNLRSQLTASYWWWRPSRVEVAV